MVLEHFPEGDPGQGLGLRFFPPLFGWPFFPLLLLNLLFEGFFFFEQVLLCAILNLQYVQLRQN